MHTQHGVRQVVLIPGTFAGDDPFAIGQILRSLGERVPYGAAFAEGLADQLAAQTQRMVDSVARDVGSWTAGYCERFTELVDGTIDVVRLEPTWSGQNHHFAARIWRFDLLCHLDRMELFPGRTDSVLGAFPRGQRVCTAQQPAGQSSTGLLNSSSRRTVRWTRITGSRRRELLATGTTPHRLSRHASFVTFGTPVRYGWDTDGYQHLLHILFDRGTPGDNLTTQPLFPPQSFRDIVDATWGDWVQAFGIAGTDVVPPTPQSLRRDEQLRDILESGLAAPEYSPAIRLVPGKLLKDLCARWKTGTRCHADGQNLLVDYRPSGRLVANRPVENSLFGHGVATTVDWLPAHLALVLQRMGG